MEYLCLYGAFTVCMPPKFPTSREGITGHHQWACCLRQHVGVGVSIKTLHLKFSDCTRLLGASCWSMACYRNVDVVEPFPSGSISRFVILLVFLSTSFPVCDSEGISPERCLIWGPGLNPDTVLPVRYFFIQAVNSKGENLTLSPGK